MAWSVLVRRGLDAKSDLPSLKNIYHKRQKAVELGVRLGYSESAGALSIRRYLVRQERRKEDEKYPVVGSSRQAFRCRFEEIMRDAGMGSRQREAE